MKDCSINDKYIGTWWNDKRIPLQRIDDEVYAINTHNYNGEVYLDCWKVYGEHYMESSKETYTIKPIFAETDEGVYYISRYKVLDY